MNAPLLNYYQARALQRGIPEYMVSGLVRWIEQHIMPGDFLRAVIENDLRAACAHADDVNQRLLWNYVNFLYNDAPSPCWGSKENVASWAARAGGDDVLS
jgi:hypothetical protein